MSVIDRMRTAQRGAVSGYLRVARLPLTAYESVVRRRRDNSTWAPAVAFEGLDASIRQLAGSLLRDETLTEQGALGKAKVAQLRKAAGLTTLAEQERLAAKADLKESQQQAEQQRQSVQQAAEQRELQLEEQRRQNVDAVKTQAAERKQQTRQAKAAVDEALDKTERAARLAALDAEAEALEAQRAAAETQSEVLDLDKAIDQLKEVRAST